MGCDQARDRLCGPPWACRIATAPGPLCLAVEGPRLPISCAVRAQLVWLGLKAGVPALPLTTAGPWARPPRRLSFLPCRMGMKTAPSRQVMERQRVVHPNKGMLLSHDRGEVLTHHNTDVPREGSQVQEAT